MTHFTSPHCYHPLQRRRQSQHQEPGWEARSLVFRPGSQMGVQEPRFKARSPDGRPGAQMRGQELGFEARSLDGRPGSQTGGQEPGCEPRSFHLGTPGRTVATFLATLIHDNREKSLASTGRGWCQGVKRALCPNINKEPWSTGNLGRLLCEVPRYPGATRATSLTQHGTARESEPWMPEFGDSERQLSAGFPKTLSTNILP